MEEGNISPQLPDKRILLLNWKIPGIHSNHSIEDLIASGIHKIRRKKKGRAEGTNEGTNEGRKKERNSKDRILKGYYSNETLVILC